MENLFENAAVIYSYGRAQAINDGVLVDANQGDFGEVSKQHFKIPVAMSNALFAIIRRAVENKKFCNDYKGIWHDILWMSRTKLAVSVDESTRYFMVHINGAGRTRKFYLKAVCGPGDNGEPVLTVM